VAGGILIAIALTAFASGAAVVLASRSPPRRQPRSPSQTLTVNCRSPALSGQLPAEVYLPAGYRNDAARYRVVYFLHGLPANPTAFTVNTFVAGALASAGHRAIVVAPQGARGPASDREYLDWDAAEDWPQAITHDLTRCIDRRFRTVTDRFGRALIGVSAGGYGAFNIGLRALSTFGAVESWSGYFAPTDPRGEHVIDLGSAQANRNARVPSGSGLAATLRTWPALVAFYVGRQDARFYEMNLQYDAQLHAGGVAHVFRVYPGGHSGALWHAQAPFWLGMAVDALRAEAARRLHHRK
jgi:enterochelin esterase-like enzyme